MRRTAKVSVALPLDHLAQIRRAVETSEFASGAAVIREAVRAFLHRRALHAGRHGAQRLSRSLEALRDAPVVEPAERVELLFDAGDAKA